MTKETAHPNQAQLDELDKLKQTIEKKEFKDATEKELMLIGIQAKIDKAFMVEAPATPEKTVNGRLIIGTSPAYDGVKILHKGTAKEVKKYSVKGGQIVVKVTGCPVTYHRYDAFWILAHALRDDKQWKAIKAQIEANISTSKRNSLIEVLAENEPYTMTELEGLLQPVNTLRPTA